MSNLRIQSLSEIVDPVDKLESKHANCIYLAHKSGYNIPVYVNNDTRNAWIGNATNRGMSDTVKMDVWRFVVALGFKPVYEETSYV